MVSVGDLVIGLGLGALAGAAHLLALRRAVAGLAGADPQTAQRRLTGGYFVRVGAFLPLLYWAALTGLGASLGLVGGLLLGRALTYGLVEGGGRRTPGQTETRER
ncbi:MAG: hypothetical protein GX657_00215 [Chloroflexi bacterium]|nr:hypothetical protein [Chloroflexota bacterium]